MAAPPPPRPRRGRRRPPLLLLLALAAAAAHALDTRPGSVQHLAANGVARFLDAGLVTRRQEDVREQREPTRHALGDQDPLRPDGKPA